VGQQDTIGLPTIRAWSVKAVFNTLAPFFKGRQHLRRWLYVSILTVMTASSTSDVWKPGNYRRYGPLLLEVTCHQHLDDMRPIVFTVDALYTNAALPRSSRSPEWWWCRIVKNPTFLLIIDFPEELLPRYLHCYKAFVELMLSSNWLWTMGT